ncbi:unnamed protein product [Phytomonas sp. Hart1]|nr:unnamed protein product [Phytomonas sp. Hart1]|eukprot:CCW69576.1 unnamed protein product [Phytomonas sp. isolate Hart1]
MPRKIILDCDPGIDDAVALILAQGSPEIDLVAVTTVAGNHTLENVTRNAQVIAALAGFTGVTIAAGCTRPLLGSLRIADAVHGETGLGVSLPEIPHSSPSLNPHHAVNVIIEMIMSNEPQSITLVPIGPLTNIAMAARLEPRIVERVQEVVLMGGSSSGGNVTPTAEFNINIDPEAARIVFNEKWPLTMLGLNLTHQTKMTEDVADRITAIGTELSQFTMDILRFYGKQQVRQTGSYPVVHDPCAVAYVIDPSVITTKRAPIDVELNGVLTRGMSVVDLRIPPSEDCHTQLGVTLDHEKFWNLIINALERIGSPN